MSIDELERLRRESHGNDACPIPNCPAKDHDHPRVDPNCTCNKPFHIYIPAGEHFHPCKVHTNVVIYGRDIRC